jgi:hypothetical protein
MKSQQANKISITVVDLSNLCTWFCFLYFSSGSVALINNLFDMKSENSLESPINMKEDLHEKRIIAPDVANAS